MTSWYDTGYGGINREEDRIANMSGPFRLWIPPGKTNQVVLIDDTPVAIYEHQWRMNGRWTNFYTCLQGVDDPVCCAEGGEKTRSYIGYYSIVQCTETVDKKGNKYQFELQLLGAKLKILKKLKRKKEERGSLAFLQFKITREDDKSPSCGDEFEAQSEVTDHAKLFSLANYRGKKLSELFDKAEGNPESMARLRRTFQLAFEKDEKTLVRRVPQFNYFELLKPKSADDLRRLFKTTKIEDKDDKSGSSSTGSDGSDVPF
jgi:hypothetical protein